jgi:hypothetical protein
VTEEGHHCMIIKAETVHAIASLNVCSFDLAQFS